jgi:predicted SAM-dependent methyltransferase
MGWGLPGILRLLPSPTLVLVDQVQRTLTQLPGDAKILDVGSGGRRIAPSVLTVDALAGPGVDIVGDIHALPIADNEFTCVFCTGTLEHVIDPWQAVKELYRVTKPGGIIHMGVTRGSRICKLPMLTIVSGLFLADFRLAGRVKAIKDA